MIGKHLLILLLLCAFVQQAQITNNPPLNSVKDIYTSGSYIRCAYNVNISETHLSADVNYLVKAGQSIRIQASSGTTPHSNVGNFSSGSFHAFVDPSYNLTGCGASGTIVWDNVYTGDGSIAREVRPVDYQLYPRNSSNKGTVVFSGTDNGNNSTITFATNKTSFGNTVSSPYNMTTVSIVNKRFYFALEIDAELSEYIFGYFLNNDPFNTGGVIADHVVCGDAYIISGQSNAETADISAAEYTSMINSYGQGTSFGKYSRTYGSIWSKATGNWGTSKLFEPVSQDMNNNTGVWGLALQYKIQQAYGIPTCIINGAVGATSIEHHLPLPSYPNDFFYNGSNDPLYPNIGISHPGCFGRMNTRVYNAGLENNIKGIFWWQEDAGSADTSYNYIDHFTPLYNLWATYYPGFSRSYIIQIPSWAGNNVGVRKTSEYQRQMKAIFPNTTVMSANGIGYHRTEPTHEIHHQVAGYLDMANRLFGLLEKDVYGKTTNINDLTPPEILSAVISGNSVTLKFNQNIYVNAALGDNISEILSVIKFNREIPLYYANILKSNPVISGQYLTFDVNSTNNITSVSYAGFIPDTAVAYIDNVGCYLRNSKNIGALSFHKVPVNPAGGPEMRTTSIETRDTDISDIYSGGIHIYPNPFSHELTITAKNSLPVHKVSITDITGRVIFETENNANHLTFDLSFLKPGVYFIQAEREGMTEKSKLVKLD